MTPQPFSAQAERERAIAFYLKPVNTMAPANQTPNKSNKRFADDLDTPKTNKKAKPPEDIFEFSARHAPEILEGGVHTACVMAKYDEINNYQGLLRDIAKDQTQLAEWVSVALAWNRKRLEAVECEGQAPRAVLDLISPWWKATKKERRKALSIHFS